MAPGGRLIVAGWQERRLALSSTADVMVLMVGAITTRPAALENSFGGLAKDACWIGCDAWVGW